MWVLFFIGIIFTLPEIIWFADIPVFECDRPTVGHPEESSLLRLVGTGSPKMFMTQTEIFDVLLEPVVFFLRGYAS